MSGTRYFDSHLHLTDAAFDGDRERVLARAAEAGVGELLTVASDPRDARRALELARSFPGVWCSAGLHPHQASEWSPAAGDALRDLAGHPEVVAIGETGLDYHYDHSPRAAQRASFAAQLELAAECGKPVIVHSRDAEADTAALLRELAGRVTGVMHCFTGGAGLLETALEAGWSVSFAGLVTFPRWDGADLLRRVPDDRLLIETDSPYLSPVPLRGRRNEPAHLPHTCAAVAATRGVPPSEVAALTRANALAFFRLPCA